MGSPDTAIMARPQLARRGPTHAADWLVWSLGALTVAQVIAGLVLAALNELDARGLIADFVGLIAAIMIGYLFFK